MNKTWVQALKKLTMAKRGLCKCTGGENCLREISSKCYEDSEIRILFAEMEGSWFIHEVAFKLKYKEWV